MDDIKPSFDIDETEITKLAEIAEAVGGTLAVTSYGRLIIYGIDDNISEVVDRINKQGSGFDVFVEAIGETTLGFTY